MKITRTLTGYISPRNILKFCSYMEQTDGAPYPITFKIHPDTELKDADWHLRGIAANKLFGIDLEIWGAPIDTVVIEFLHAKQYDPEGVVSDGTIEVSETGGFRTVQEAMA